MFGLDCSDEYGDETLWFGSSSNSDSIYDYSPDELHEIAEWRRQEIIADKEREEAEYRRKYCKIYCIDRREYQKPKIKELQEKIKELQEELQWRTEEIKLLDELEEK